MGLPRLFVVFLVGVPVLTGCATTRVSNSDGFSGERVPRPGRIVVYDFAATPDEIPDWSEVRGAYGHAQADPEDVAEARRLGAELARVLVEQINEMGMYAVRQANQPGMSVNDIAITGYFSSVEEGSAAERMVIGFGKGAAGVGVHTDGYQKTSAGMRRLGGGDVDAEGGKAPGMVAPALITVATKNPVGLAVSTAVKAEGEVSGRTTDEGAVRRVAEAIAERLRFQFQRQGWI